MRIVNLKIKNIASLKGEHHIDFENILNHSGVFAITGETGAGKSTLLNCISLALYGQNYKRANKQKDFITLGEASGEIELTYSIGIDTYKAYWFLRLKKSDGNYLKTPQLERRFEKIINHSWSTIQESPEETLKLTFDQFTKTIVLNQGEFAKFLTSGFKERKDILAKLYDGEKLEKLSQHVRSKITDLKNKTEIFNSHIEGINENTNFSLDDAKIIVKNQKDQLSQLNEIKLKNTDISKNLEELYKLKIQYEKNSKLLKIIKENLAEIIEKKNVLNREHKQNLDNLNNAKEFFDKRSPILIESITQQKLLTEAKKNEKDLSHEAYQIEKAIQDEFKNIEELKKSNIEFEAKLKTVNLSIDKKFSKKELDDLESLIKNFDKSLEKEKILSSEIEGLNSQIKEIEANANRIKDLLKDKNVNDIESYILSIKEKLKKSQKSKETIGLAISDIKQYIISLNNNQKEIKANEDLLANNDKEINSYQSQIPELNQRLKEQSLAVKSFDLQAHLNIVTKESINKGECLVCHNQDISNIDVSDQNEADKLSIETRMQSTQNEIKNLEVKIQGLRSSQTHYRSTIRLGKERMTQESSVLLNKYDFLVKKEIEKDPKLSLNKLEITFETETKKINEIQKELESEQNKLTLTQERQKQLDQYRLDYKKRADHLEDLTTTLDKLKSEKFKLNEQIFVILQTSIKENEYLETLSKIKEFTHTEQRLKDNLKSIADSKKRHDSLIERQVKNKESVKTIEKQIIEKEEFLKQLDGLDPQIELDRLKEELESINKKLQTTTSKLNETKIKIAEETSKEKNYFEQNEQTDNLFKITSADINTLVSIIPDIDLLSKHSQEVEGLKGFYKKLRAPLSIQKIEEEILKETFEFSEKQVFIFDHINKEISESLIKNEVLIKNKIEAEEKIKDIKEQMDSLTEQRTQLEDLYDLVGKDEFRNFVLSLIEKNLITQTNHELKNLCDDRYIIQHFSKNVQSMPDFYVVDKYRAGLTRKVSTLSGGETFMVSLAMALALAELTRGTSEVDSFFIDEGFGTLDDDSLEDVLDMINTMEQRGKSIGLISHIKKLTDRISVNIFLNKNESGNSTINVKYN